MDEELKLKYEEAIWTAKALFQHRIITGTTGNISFLHNEKMYITKSGSCLGKLDKDSFAITDLNGNILFNKPSKEYIMHLALYNSNETYKAIIHTHSFYTTLLSYNKHSYIDTPYMKFKNEKLKYIAYFPPGSKELFSAVENSLEENNDTYILEKHGIICAKDTLLSAFGTIEEIEYGAKLSFLLTEKNKTGPLT